MMAIDDGCEDLDQSPSEWDDFRLFATSFMAEFDWGLGGVER